MDGIETYFLKVQLWVGNKPTKKQIDKLLSAIADQLYDDFKYQEGVGFISCKKVENGPI